MASEKSVWDSNIAFVLAMIGSAVGLGNIWRFPNVLYSNGGGSFMIPYIISIFLLGISFVLVEYAVGYKFKSSLIKVLYTIKTKLEPVAWFIALIVFLITTYYICVVGWDLIYVFLSFTKAWGSNPDLFFSNNVLQASDSISGMFTIVPMVFLSVLALWAIGWYIVQKDLNEGIGKVSKVLLPLLCIIVVIIVAFSLTLPGASIGYTQIFTPDWSALTNLNVWLAAFGQIIFSLSMGQAIAVTYAGYLPENSRLVDNVLVVVAANSGFELFTSLGVFSILGFMSFTSGLPIEQIATSGTGLLFVVFPEIFNVMGDMAYVIAPIFFLCVFFAGVTSALAFLEPMCLAVSRKFRISRARSVTLLCIFGFILSLVFTTASGNYVLTIADSFINQFGILLAVILQAVIFGWIYGVDKLIPVLNEHSTVKIGRTWVTVIKYIMPVFLSIMWIIGIFDLLNSQNSVEIIIQLLIAVIIVAVPFTLTKLKAR